MHEIVFNCMTLCLDYQCMGIVVSYYNIEIYVYILI
jgi:hypothetical protein